jgi:hypothetical protein
MLDLRRNQLSDAGAQHLAALLLVHPSIGGLNVSKNRLARPGLDALLAAGACARVSERVGKTVCANTPCSPRYVAT